MRIANVANAYISINCIYVVCDRYKLEKSSYNKRKIKQKKSVPASWIISLHSAHTFAFSEFYWIFESHVYEYGYNV